MSETYNYSISGDFPNGKVNTSIFTVEIEQSSISSAALEMINTSGDDCDVVFDGALSGGDETTLDGLVAAHQGDVVPESGTVTTTDATETTLLEGPVPEGAAYLLVAEIAAIGSNDKPCGFHRMAVVYRLPAGSAVLYDLMDANMTRVPDSAMFAKFDVNGNNFRIRVKGLAATTVVWIAKLDKAYAQLP